MLFAIPLLLLFAMPIPPCWSLFGLPLAPSFVLLAFPLCEPGSERAIEVARVLRGDCDCAFVLTYASAEICKQDALCPFAD